MEIDIKHACSFTGHRPERLEMRESKVISWLEEQIRKAVADGYTDFITGMQRGVDIWAGEIVLKLKQERMPVKLICACAWNGMEKDYCQPPRRLHQGRCLRWRSGPEDGLQ